MPGWARMPRAISWAARRGTEPVRATDAGDSSRVGTTGPSVELGGCPHPLTARERLPVTRAGAPACDPAGMTWHEIERAQLAQALLDVSPDAPTLCEGWQARHLAAHVVLRERSPIVGAGIAVPALSARAEAAIARLADTAPTEGAYRDLVARVAADRPAFWHPGAWAGDRPTSSSSSCTPRTSAAAPARSPPRSSTRSSSRPCGRSWSGAGGLRLRKVPVGVVLVRDDGVRHRRARRGRARHGRRPRRRRRAGLYLLGRGAAADVEVEGDADDVARARAGPALALAGRLRPGAPWPGCRRRRPPSARPAPRCP